MAEFPTSSYTAQQPQTSMLTLQQPPNPSNPPAAKKPQPPSTPHEKTHQLRQQSRHSQIQNLKKTIRFSWNIAETLSYLQSIEYQKIDSEEILVQAIEEKNTEYLVELIVAADPLFKSAVVAQCYCLVGLVEGKFQEPSSVLLLGNLCALYQEFIEVSASRKLLTKLLNLAVKIKSNKKCLQICTWTLTQMSRQPHLLSQQQILSNMPNLYCLLSQAFTEKDHSKLLCTHLCRLVSQFAVPVAFSDEFLGYLVTIRPLREIDRFNMFIAMENQVKNASYSENTELRIQVAEYLLWLYQWVEEKMSKPKTKSKSSCIYSLLTTLVQKSQQPLALHLITTQFTPLLSPYKYSHKRYYKLLHSLLLKLSRLPSPFLSLLHTCSLLQNLIHDISDTNREIGYLCLLCVTIIVEQVLGDGDMEEVEGMLGLGLQRQVEEFMDGVKGGDDGMWSCGEKLLDMIASNK